MMAKEVERPVVGPKFYDDFLKLVDFIRSYLSELIFEIFMQSNKHMD